MNESRLREREARSASERRPRGDRPPQQGMSVLGWIGLAVAAYVAYQTLPSLQRYLRIERM
jgi:hypothetical protein